MVMYLPVKSEFNWTKRFRVRVRKRKCWRTNEQMELYQFQKEPSYDGDLSPRQVWIWLDTAFSSWSPETEMLTNKRTKNGQTARRNYTNFKRNLAMMVIYVPVKFEFDWTNRFRVRVCKRKMWGRTEGWTDKRTKNGQTNRRNYTKFERNLAMMVIYVPVKLKLDWTNRFRVRVWKWKCGQTDGWTDKQTKNGQTNGRNYTNFKRSLAMMVIYLSVKFEFDWSNHFELQSGNKNVDGQTDRRRTHQSNRRIAPQNSKGEI